MKRYLFSILLLGLFAFAAPMSAQTSSDEALVAPSDKTEIQAPSLQEAADQISANSKADKVSIPKPAPTAGVVPQAGNGTDIFEAIGLFQQLAKAWKNPINSIGDFNVVLGLLIMIATFLVTFFSKWIPGLNSISDNETRFIAVAITVGLTFTVMKGDFTAGMFFQWFASSGMLSILYKILTERLNFLKTPKVAALAA